LTNPLLPILTKLRDELSSIINNLDDSFHIRESETTRRLLNTCDDVVSACDTAVTDMLKTANITDHKNCLWDHYADDPRCDLVILRDKQLEDEADADSPEGIAASRSDDLHDRRMEA
jgi:hypothetical protein